MSAASTRSLSEQQLERFARQIIVPGVGAEGQLRLCAAEVFVDGHPEGARVATQYLRAAGVRVESATNPPSHLDCVVLAAAGSLPTDRIRLLIDSAPLVAWYALVEHGVRGGLANASRGLPDLALPSAAPNGTREGVKDRAGWLGYAEVAAAAARLSQIVIDVFVAAGVPGVSLPPSGSARCADGRLANLDTYVLRAALEHGLVPLVQGDLALDVARGATIFRRKMSSSISSVNSSRRIFCWRVKWRASTSSVICVARSFRSLLQAMWNSMARHWAARMAPT